MDFLNGLNEEQKKAVLHVDGPLLILAGAGSGKTKVLTNRIAYLIKEKNIYPSNILAITFTNKAAKEMKVRIEKLVGDETNNIWISTFHSACVRMLRKDIEKIGYEKSFVIFDSSDQQVVVKDCLKELGLNEKNYPPRSVLEMIGKAKDELMDPKSYSKVYAADFRMGKIAQVYELYQKKLVQSNALDFDDIIMKTITLFTQNPEVLDFYQRKFRYILVDEYQDTNTAQYSLISLLSKGHKNLCVVGDDDQSIYGWRGANIRNILDFEKEFVGCNVIKLEQNYRSTQNILDAANAVIRNNYGRKNKSLWTENLKGNNISHFEAVNEHDEASFVTSEIKKIMSAGNREYKDFAVLYRINAQSRVLEDMLMREGIPYRIIGGQKFYDRKEIKDIVAYLRVIQNPSDNISLKRIINVPKRGIGATTLESAEKAANARGCSIFTLIACASEVPELQRAAAKLESFVSIIAKFRALKGTLKLSELIERVIKESGMLGVLEDENTVEAQSRIENIKEFISVALDFEKQNEEQEMEEFLANISLVADIDNLEEDSDNIILMTLHSAKGLEFPVVFMVGMEEGVFPGYRSMTEESELEEERRICYVGITRAKEKLFVLNTKSRTLFGNTTYNRMSRFLKEIPEELMDELNIINAIKAVPKKEFGGIGGAKSEPNIGFGRKVTPALLNEIKKPTGNVKYIVGDTVEHKKFGVGVVTSIEKEKDDFKIEIQFESAGMKRLMAAYANLNKIS